MLSGHHSLSSAAAHAPAGVSADPGAAVLEAASAALIARRLAEAAEMRLAAQWAEQHGHPRDERDPMVEPGGEGTPLVREYAIAELAFARETHYATTRALIADTLDLQHRLPRTWRVLIEGACEPWVARKVAVLSRSVPLQTAWVVDRAVAKAIAGHAPSTVLELAQAKVIEADPEAYAMRRLDQARRRYVALGKTDEFGLRHVIARVTAGDAVWLDALVDRVADILAAEHGPDANRDQLRSMAFGWLARPADLLKLLLDHTDLDDADPTTTDPTVTEPQPSDQQAPVWAPPHLAATVDRLTSMSTRQLAALRGKGQVYVHLTDTTLARQAGIARVEGQGPMIAQALCELLGHADVRITPVLDLAARPRVDQYEHPETHKDLAWLLAGGDLFPFSPRTATRGLVDFDHVIPYDPDAGPGQTGPHNCAPLRRTHHRWKTLAGFRYRICGPGRVLWQAPQGTCVLVDHAGTRRLTPEQAETLLTARPGIDLYLTPEIQCGPLM